MDEESRVKGTNEILMDVRLDIRELNTKMDGFKDVSKKVEENTLVSTKALQSSDSAHKRIDKIDKIVFWVVTTIIGGVIIGILALLFNSK
jgi:hypothetical protein